MVALYVVSNEPYSGKTLACLALGTRWRRRGLRVGYLKPVGMIPLSVDGEVTDEDAPFVAAHLGYDAPPSQLCPVLLGPSAYRGEPGELRKRIREAFERGSAGQDIMLIGGLGPLFSCGCTVGLCASDIAHLLDAKVLLVARSEPMPCLTMDSISAAHQMLGDRLVGAILNRVLPGERDCLKKEIIPTLEAHGVPVLGMLPDDPVLSSVSVMEVVKATCGEMLCGEEHANQLIENFVVGAMGVESALRHFRRTARKCVITGGDRIDIQFAALETPTRCLLLTGNLRPSHRVIARAAELGVPVVLVPTDTLSTVSTVEQILGKQRVREASKVDHALAHFEHNLNLDKLEQALGLA